MKSLSLLCLSILFLSACSQAPVQNREPANYKTCYYAMSEFFKKPVTFADDNRAFHLASDLDDLESLYKDNNFTEIQKKESREAINANNKRVLQLLKEPVTNNYPTMTSYVTPLEARRLYLDLKNNKIHKKTICYDPKDQTGFCFGRAVMVHMEALSRGVSPDAIKKIWIVGDMGKWAYHVAAMVKVENDWYVIDTEVGMVVKASDWISHFKKDKVRGASPLMIFISSAERFTPFSANQYSTVDLFNTATGRFIRKNDFYGGYFYDYYNDLERRKLIKKFPVR